MPDLSFLAENYGTGAICIALILLIGFLMNRVFKFFGNHVAHETDAWNRNTEALTKLTDKINQDIEAQSETTATLRDLKEVIRTR